MIVKEVSLTLRRRKHNFFFSFLEAREHCNTIHWRSRTCSKTTDCGSATHENWEVNQCGTPLGFSHVSPRVAGLKRVCPQHCSARRGSNGLEAAWNHSDTILGTHSNLSWFSRQHWLINLTAAHTWVGAVATKVWTVVARSWQATALATNCIRQQARGPRNIWAGAAPPGAVLKWFSSNFQGIFQGVRTWALGFGLVCCFEANLFHPAPIPIIFVLN